MIPTSPSPSPRPFFAAFIGRFLASLAAWGLVLVSGVVHPAAAQGVPVEMSEFRVKDPATGLGIYVRNQWAAATFAPDPESGATTPPYMVRAIFARLTRAPWKQYVMIGAGTHTVMMEKNRDQLFAAVADFLTMPAPHP